MAGKKGPTKAGRSSKTGQFVPKDHAKKHPSTSVVEIAKQPAKPKPGSTQSTGPRIK